jgi:hypothetical protein
MRRIRPVVAAMLIGWYVPGCYAWHPAPPTPEAIAKADSTKAIRVSTARTRYHVTHPLIDGDSLRGAFLELRADGDWAVYGPTVAQAVAVADITRVEVRAVDGGRTALATVLGVLVVGGAITALVVSSMDFGGLGGGGSGDSSCGGGWGGCSIVGR